MVPTRHVERVILLFVRGVRSRRCQFHDPKRLQLLADEFAVGRLLVGLVQDLQFSNAERGPLVIRTPTLSVGVLCPDDNHALLLLRDQSNVGLCDLEEVFGVVSKHDDVVLRVRLVRDGELGISLDHLELGSGLSCLEPSVTS